MGVIDELEAVQEISIGGRGRITRLVDLVTGDILIDGDNYYRVDEGEVSIYADKKIDATNGILTPVSIEAITFNDSATRVIFNMEDV